MSEWVNEWLGQMSGMGDKSVQSCLYAFDLWYVSNDE